MTPRNVFITGGTGYVGRALIPRLLERGHEVRALVRRGSEIKIPRGCEAVIGNALDVSSFAESVPPSDTFVQLVGVPHPSPAKAAEFQSIDLASSPRFGVGCRWSRRKAFRLRQRCTGLASYQAARAEGEKMIHESGLAATILRPWYVLGPGHRWPYALVPMYWLFERISATRETAQRLGLVTLEEMVGALLHSVESPADGIRILDVPSIRNTAQGKQ